MMVLLTAEEYRELQTYEAVAKDKWDWINKYEQSEENAAVKFIQAVMPHLGPVPSDIIKKAADEFIHRPSFESFQPKP